MSLILFKKRKSYEYIYMFIMVIYMAHMTKETRAMVENINESIIGFMIPVVLTFVLCYRNKISFINKNLLTICLTFLSWTFIQYTFNYKEGVLSYYLFLFYAIIISFVHLNIYKERLFLYYEDIIVILCKISLVCWGLALIFPDILQAIFNEFPKAGYGHHFFYIFNLTSNNGAQEEYGIIRNSGFSWEPGRFSVMLCFAIMINIARQGVKFTKNNKNIFWLIAGVISTMSTTGYITTLSIIILNYIKNITLSKIPIFLIIAPFVVIIVLQLSFIGEKLQLRLNYEKQVESVERNNDWYDQHTEDNEMAFAIDRFSSMYFELENIENDPIIGYGRSVRNSYFYKTFSYSLGITGGLLQIFGMYGIFLGVFIYYLLYKSSLMFNIIFPSLNKYSLLLCFVLSLISYPLFCYPIFTAFWFTGSFFSIKK